MCRCIFLSVLVVTVIGLFVCVYHGSCACFCVGMHMCVCLYFHSNHYRIRFFHCSLSFGNSG